MIAKQHLKQFIRRSSVLRLRQAMRGTGPIILYYHSVCDDPEQQRNYISTGITTSTASFREHMRILRSEYDPISLTDVASWLDGQTQLSNNSVVVTFDDGFADNYEVAAPLLEEFDIQGTFYLTAGCIEQQTLPWFSKIRYLLEQGVTKGARIRHPLSDLKADLSQPDGYRRGWLMFGECCAKTCGDKQNSWVNFLADQVQSTYDEDNAPRMMTWENARELHQRGHLLGNHTMSHPNMAYLSFEDQADEITSAHDMLTDRLGVATQHFSYPHPCLNPQWDRTSQAMLSELGYETQVLTQPGCVQRSSHAAQLPRISMSESCADEFRWKLECSFSGVHL